MVRSNRSLVARTTSAGADVSKSRRRMISAKSVLDVTVVFLPFRTRRSSISCRRANPGCVEDDRVVLGPDHHDHHGDVRDVIDRVDQCTQERDVLVREVAVLGERELADVVEDLVDQDQDRPPDRPDRLARSWTCRRSAADSACRASGRRRIAATGSVRRARRPVRHSPGRRGPRSCCRTRGRPPAGCRGPRAATRRSIFAGRRPGFPPDVRGPELDGVCGQMPEADHGVRLAAAHRLIEPPERGSCRVARPPPSRTATRAMNSTRFGLGWVMSP